MSFWWFVCRKCGLVVNEELKPAFALASGFSCKSVSKLQNIAAVRKALANQVEEMQLLGWGRFAP